MKLSKKIKKKQSAKMGRMLTRKRLSENRAKAQVRHSFIRQNVTEMSVKKSAMEDLFVIFMAAAHDALGFGKDRLAALKEKMLSHLECMRCGLVTVADIENILRDEANYGILREKNKDRSRTTEIRMKAVDEVSAAFMISLLDGWGYKKVRLARAHKAAGDISVQLANGTLTFAKIKDVLTNKVKFAA
ncbi:hypothetical protein [Selenomonas ruminantium]|uniref:Uncharacterized protein n=1 Tax=Selenomonas ruminantium TaxID=971 RepID=A0A1I0YBY6_SELRU|nr:hypothetical protein [Selenomonas ruminantium]SFB10692.1 hypothetical protein SAMN05216587_11190 [Selenomonas ruminantium]